MREGDQTTQTVSTICDALGRKAVARRIGVGVTAVSNACTDNMFPAKWFAAVRQMCSEKEMDCPEVLFSFLPASTAPVPPMPQEDAA